jgi:histone-lysine N-methyltransferase SETMAR
VCLRTICRILKEDLGLVKKSARWVPKLLSQVQKEERVRISQEFVDAVERSGLSMLDNIITMNETLVSYFTPETKRMSKEWTMKGKQGPLKAKVQASRSKQMVFVVFDSRGLIYTHIASRSATINAPYVVDVLGKFWRSLRLKRPELLSQRWFFHWDNVPVHTTAVVSDWFDAHGVQQLKHPLYSPDLAPADFFLFRKV